MHRVRGFNFLLAAALVAMLASFVNPALAASYQLINLDSNQQGQAKHVDPQLINGWGLAFAPGNPWWIADEGSGFSTLYDGKGNKQTLVVKVPSASGQTNGTPTGIVYNGSQEFKVKKGTGEPWASVFIFATLDGTISGWAPLTDMKNAIIAVDNSATGASYTGLAITSKSSGNFIYAADSVGDKVDVYDGNFAFVTSFSDPQIPKNFTPFGIQDINGQVYVAYAEIHSRAGGFIDIFSEDGTFVKRFAQGKPLNQPWGFAVAPSNFGPLSKTLLITNNTPTGTINGFNLTTGKFVGTLKNSAGKPFVIDQLWGIGFGGGSPANGQKNQLFFTAGPKNYVDGTFGLIQFK